MYMGWIKLHRKVMGHWLFSERRPFSRFEAWIYLLLTVNHGDNVVVFGGTALEVKRGSTITSIKELCSRWGWSNTKVRSFLKTLEREGMIELKSDSRKTSINIVNYSLYQNLDDGKYISETYRKKVRDTSENNEKNTNNNDKNEKNGKKKYAEFVTMTNAEYQKLVGTYGEEKVRRMIVVLDNYKGSNGRKYKNDYRAILNWVVARVEKEDSKAPTLPNAGAYKSDDEKCPICSDSGWVLVEGHEERCSCCYGGELSGRLQSHALQH